MVGACQSPASLQFDEAGAGRCERLGRKSTRSECPETRPATPASTARLVMIERIDGAPRRPVTVAPSLSNGRRQETGSVRRVVRCALDDFCSGPLFLTCNALGQTAVMPGHLVEYNSSIAGEE